MSSVLRQCIPSTSRVICPSARIFARLNSSNVRKGGHGGKAPTLAKISHETVYNTPDPMYDNEIFHHFEPTVRAPTRPGSFVREGNWQPVFYPVPEPQTIFRRDNDGFEDEVDEELPGDERQIQEDMSPLQHLPIPFKMLGDLHRYPLLTRRVVQQTGKGKIQSMYCLIVVGNGDGLVGLGEGKADSVPLATDKAFGQAVRNMDFVDRFEGRTLWADLDTKLGATRILMRPRPVGFGLACAPGIHQVLKAAGIKDCSAKVWGSRNKLNVVKAVIRVLHAGHASLAMGDGIGGPGRRMDAGSGMRGKEAVERERGRVIVTGRTW